MLCSHFNQRHHKSQRDISLLFALSSDKQSPKVLKQFFFFLGQLPSSILGSACLEPLLFHYTKLFPFLSSLFRSMWQHLYPFNFLLHFLICSTDILRFPFLICTLVIMVCKCQDASLPTQFNFYIRYRPFSIHLLVFSLLQSVTIISDRCLCHMRINYYIIGLFGLLA